ncbi:UDP-N-acetylmuramoylalanyl-D-glutamate-2,6-diaminopimelate ligase [Buchnera aphidicola str. Bp (Baizongia pistaciae)]|uniref:UDP-N-acetylmuramoyl-L-alanyl-D-glutamate--2,6-diaminopimelate ligase n=1 Tax=Buchnera aphidicola subsp. Baizongia pistaciae (strain Bp) TaxID=224915 RepID=MURE_BUCBP|nr:UDP-N-acetylmuramoyl-L-alanyl-D-glutamate--2,6-diaminopimelate ligase [Buchnera aphidicola]P59419.1 RecName: Full=UDP-N-acetylmuramoyl-L-alanyl-D-glutamate--2,6-diaminopimelate ligase; AltName: Full=Meso-A2pm-adding enzyme; AltName: Full=Meso-diaminopimelate-adding enzyme; AltName: Full=UDP-MurNAc-L-Ala-D-Glu:meso-diaminopimelate ligase; AltName: Full=UDP-MurNAc-tripeptide synthetase; AltName: Full=UDP-N-acetylmuramyl-tripeptide synthetase [Buchnera aphidicola str. Bp (Baizongia pistaciae)]AAO
MTILIKNNNLQQLLSSWIKLSYSYTISGIQSDSRLVKPGYLFCVLKKKNINETNKHMIHAIKNGAKIILYDTKQKFKNGTLKKIINHVPIIYFFKLSKNLPQILKKYYHFENNFTLIGITGTNGKSTTTHIVSQWANLLNVKIGIMGTLGHGINNNLKKTDNTTESSANIHQFLYHMLKQNIKTFAIEISSHGIVQHRIEQLPFKIAILTNITPEHLDYHRTMDNYINAKKAFFFKYNINTLIINADDLIAKTWIKKLNHKNVITITTKDQNFNSISPKKWIHANKIIQKQNCTNIHFNSSWGHGILNSTLIGHFNVINILLALATLLELNYPITDLVKVCKYIKTISGRMEHIHIVNKPKVIIDYAHNTNGLKNLLSTLKEIFNKKKIWCIFGCGGDRDKTKRPYMGSIAEKMSDQVILTNDNPRNEHPLKIIKNILSGCKFKNKIRIIPNREHAIKFAVNNADKEDIIVVAGKGHEKYQIINNKYYHFSDHKIIKKLLNKKNYDFN